jgi:predicted RNase H-like HicB family nuclease
MDYKVVVHRGEDRGWVIECPALPGCVSQGHTLDEALTNIRDAIHACMEVLNARAQRTITHRNARTRVIAVRV